MIAERIGIVVMTIAVIYMAALVKENVDSVDRLQKINAQMSGNLAGFRTCAWRREVYNEISGECLERFPMECRGKVQWEEIKHEPPPPPEYKEDTTFTWHLQKGSMFLLNNPGVENGNNSTDAGFDVKASGPAAFMLSPTSVAEIGWCTCSCSRPTAQSELEGDTKPVHAKAVWSPRSGRAGW